MPFCVSQISLRPQGYHKDDVNLATLVICDITGCETVVCVCLSDRENGIEERFGCVNG